MCNVQVPRRPLTLHSLMPAAGGQARPTPSLAALAAQVAKLAELVRGVCTEVGQLRGAVSTGLADLHARIGSLEYSLPKEAVGRAPSAAAPPASEAAASTPPRCGSEGSAAATPPSSGSGRSRKGLSGRLALRSSKEKESR